MLVISILVSLTSVSAVTDLRHSVVKALDKHPIDRRLARDLGACCAAGGCWFAEDRKLRTGSKWSCHSSESFKDKCEQCPSLE
jgi:hypothetical protein